MKKNTKHTLKWVFAFAVAIVLFLLWFVPFAKWLIVDHTLALYKETAECFAEDDAQSQQFKGTVTDTLFYPSTTVKGKTDTVLHRQSVLLSQQEPASGARPRREDVGVFGDAAGLFNAFFSFLAFLGVIITMYLQSRKDSQEKQNGARVLFEQEFFAMVGMLENIVAHLKFTDNKPVEDKKIINDIVKNLYGGSSAADNDDDEKPEPIVVEGREVFRYIYTDRENYNLLQYVTKEKDLRQSAVAQEMCFDGTLDHYFRYLYRILKHIDESELLGRLDDPDKEREYYAHLLRAQLSNYELKMLFYNGLLAENPGTIKVLIEKYAMFNNLRAWELGKYQKDYYQAILDDCLYEDPEGYDEETTYSVKAFWDEGKRLKFKKDAEKERKKENNLIIKVKGWLKRDKKEKDVAKTEPLKPVEPVDPAKETTAPEKPKKKESANSGVKNDKSAKKNEKKKDKTNNLKEKRRGRGKKKR